MAMAGLLLAPHVPQDHPTVGQRMTPDASPWTRNQGLCMGLCICQHLLQQTQQWSGEDPCQIYQRSKRDANHSKEQDSDNLKVLNLHRNQQHKDLDSEILVMWWGLRGISHEGYHMLSVRVTHYATEHRMSSCQLQPGKHTA